MRRPLCVFCAGMLGVEFVCAFLPQTELFVPFAAFFVAVCLVLCIFDAARKAALCILLGAAVGMASVLYTANRLERIRVQYAARPLVLTAEVESVSDSYYPGVVDAVLRVEKINGAKTSFRVECETLPECEAGQRVQGRFVLSVPAQQSRTRRNRISNSWGRAAASVPAPTGCSKGSAQPCAAAWMARLAACWRP